MSKEQFLALWAAWYDFDRAARQMETASIANVTERAETLEAKRRACWEHMVALQTTVARQGMLDEGDAGKTAA